MPASELKGRLISLIMLVVAGWPADTLGPADMYLWADWTSRCVVSLGPADAAGKLEKCAKSTVADPLVRVSV